MGYFNEQGRYELTFDEYDSIEEAIANDFAKLPENTPKLVYIDANDQHTRFYLLNLFVLFIIHFRDLQYLRCISSG